MQLVIAKAKAVGHSPHGSKRKWSQVDYLPGPGFRPWHFRLIWVVFCASSFLSAGCGRSRFSIKPAILMHGMPDAILDQNMREAAERDGLHDLLLHSSHCLRFFCMTFCLSAHLASMVLGAHGTTTRKVFIDGLRCDPKKLLRKWPVCPCCSSVGMVYKLRPR